MSDKRTILITAASGNLGKVIIPFLANSAEAANYTLVLLTRRASNVGVIIPSNTASTIHIAEGEPGNAIWLEQEVFRKYGVDTVLSNFAGIEELFLTLNLWSVAESAGVKHLIFMSAGFDCSLEAVKAGNLARTGSAAHCAAKFPLEHALVYGNKPFTWTILGPTLFFSNDLQVPRDQMPNVSWSFGTMGYKGASRVDNADIALAVKKTVDDGGKQYHGRKIYLGTKEVYTAKQAAELWGRELGRKVDDSLYEEWKHVSEYERVLAPAIGGFGAWSRDLALMADDFNKHGFALTDEQYREQVEFLGKEASNYEEFVKKTAAIWKSTAADV